LLLRPQNEKEASVISIWHRLVNTLIENVLNNPQMATDSDAEGMALKVKSSIVVGTNSAIARHWRLMR